MAGVPETQEQFSGRLFTMQPLAHTVGMTFQDHFSAQVDAYARFQPTYPDALYVWLVSRVPTRAGLGLRYGQRSGRGRAGRTLHSGDRQ